MSNWAQFVSVFSQRYRLRNDLSPNELGNYLESVGITVGVAEQAAFAYSAYVRHPGLYPYGTGTYSGAQLFYQYILDAGAFPPPSDIETQVQDLLGRQAQGEALANEELCTLGFGLFLLGFNDAIPYAQDSGGGFGSGSGNQPKRLPEILLPREKFFERAQNRALELLGKIDPATRRPFVASLPASRAYGKVIGFETRVDGVWKRFRLDYDPIKGPHINVEIGKGANAERYVIPWEGTEQDFLAQIRRLQR